MLTFDEAKKRGVDACIDKLGRDFVMKYREKSSAAYSDMDDFAYCFVGVTDRPDKNMDEELILSCAPEDRFPYIARCNVNYNDGEITFLDCVLPGAANA